MTFKHLIQLLFAIVQRFFRPMNASQNVKSTIPQAKEETRPSFHIEDTEPVLASGFSKVQDSNAQNDSTQMADAVEQTTEQINEITQEERLLPSGQTDASEAESLPSLIIEATDPIKASIEESAPATSEKAWIDIGGENLLLTAVLESILFVADGPVSPTQLAKVLPVDLNRIESGLQALAQLYEQNGRGLRLQARDGKFLLITLPAVATVIEDFLNLDTSAKLSTPALETLAVIAYRQPITRMQIEAVRGVDSASVLRSLVQRGLVEEIGRLEVAGRPFLYGVTDLFMQHFGLTKIEDLPPLQSSEADTLWATAKLAELNELTS